MIEWWWLLVEGGVFLLLAVLNRGVARKAALLDALAEPERARAELAASERWKP
jgi:hypothetical protein